MKLKYLIFLMAPILLSCEREESIIIDEVTIRGNINGYEWVDLGLPSGLKWATCNVGASSPSDCGNYYAWGETSTKSEYTEDNCKTWEIEMNDISGNPEYDAARANWGGSWRMPTKDEFIELINNCNWDWETNGYRVSSKIWWGVSIFLPASGFTSDTKLWQIGSELLYWSSTPDSPSHGSYCIRHEDVIAISRELGICVRAVSE